MNSCLSHLSVIALVLAGSLSLGAFAARADLEISASVQIHSPADFYEPLAAEGAWVNFGTYGRCWHPARVEADWRPYGSGTWVWTDAGWYWQSDEPWAWACYHYGAWVYDPAVGWIWVPDVEWAPAWVSWRVGGGYIGWAPCGPRGYVVDPAHFVFCETGHFSDRHVPATVIINNMTIINKTSIIADASRESREIGGQSRTVVFNHGPDVAMVEKARGRKMATVSIQTASRRTVVPKSVIHRSTAPEERPIPSDAHPQPKLAPEERPLPPTRTTDYPAYPVPPDKTLPPSKSEVPFPQQPPKHELPAPNQHLTPPNGSNPHLQPPAGNAPHPEPNHNHDQDQGHDPHNP